MPMSRRLGVRSNSVPVTREEAAESPPNPDEAPPSDRREAAVGWATWVGLALALVGLIDGLMMALKRKVAACPDGKYFPEGTTDFTCYAHPQAGLGIAIAALSVVLGILIVLCSMVASQSGGPSTIRLTGKDRVAPSRIRPHMPRIARPCGGTTTGSGRNHEGAVIQWTPKQNGWPAGLA